MPTISDTRDTVLNIINEVRRRLGVPVVSAITDDDHSRVMLDYLNDVITYISDWGDWKETLREIEVTASSGIRDYTIETSAVVKTVKEVVFGDNIASMRVVTVEDIRRHVRSSATGQPIYWSIVGVNSTTGNPVMRVSPEPSTDQNNETFKIMYHERPRRLTTSDGSYVVPFDSRIVVKMLMALALLDESRGTQNIDYATEFAQFENALKENYNRYNSDNGTDVRFRVVR